jgi:5-formyltetrahydrofolate cyclo-ligase
MTKKELRKQFLEKRLFLNKNFQQEKNQAICQNFFDYFDLSQIKKLHVFLPILTKHEINTWLIIQSLFQNYPQITVVTSKSDFKSANMESFQLEMDTQIVENRWGILEPVNAAKCADEKTIDMILMPLLCFDKRGYRVGYGKGFYDRFLLQKCRTDIIKVGLSWFEPIQIIEDINEYDVKMDFCVMSDRVWNLTRH